MLDDATRKKIDQIVDDDKFLEKARNIAQLAVDARLKDNQIRNLQNIVNSTTRFSEITNFVKAQTGRHFRDWQKLGPAIIRDLQGKDGIDQKAGEISNPQNSKGEIRLQLCRHWIKIVVAEFLYAKVIK